MISKASEAPLVVLNSFGFSGAETLATYLSAHDEIGLLPGQNFIQQNHTLYRPITLPIDDAKACFDLLATKQYTKTGIQWAGLGKFMSPAYSARYSLDNHRACFIEEYTNLPDEKRSFFTDVVKLYTQCFFQTMGESLSRLSYYGVYGSNFILNAPAYPNFHRDTRILQVKPSPAQWLSLASQARTWNPENALCFYIIQNLCIAQCERKQNNILSISYTELIKDTQNTLEQCCEFLVISPCTVSTVVAGLGHAPATQAFFDKIFLDASDIETIYSGSDWFETANNFHNWCDSFLNDANAVNLLEKYQTYWNSTSHIAFDWIGPLEKQLKQLISYHANEIPSQSTIKPLRVAYQFYQQWYKLDSTNHAKVVGDACYPLGAIESEIPLPKLQYFMRIAINYIQSSVELQGEKLHSYHPAREGHLYKQLCKPEFQQSIDRNGLREAFATMEATIDKTESLFDEQRRTGLLNAGMLTGSNTINSPTADISEDEIKAIAVSGPDITEHENTFVAQAMSDWYSKPYFYCEEFEQQFAHYHNRKFGLMTPSCTTANHLLLMGLGIGPGDEVLVPECTWIASASPVYYTGAQMLQ